MKLTLKLGIPLLVLLLLASSQVEGAARTLVLILAMGVALWTAFSLPHPGPREPEPDDRPPGVEDDERD